MAPMDRLGEALVGAKLNLFGIAEVLENAATAFLDKVSGAAKDTRSRETAAAVAGKVCIITGGNAGIGLATAEELTRLGGDVVLACRSAERAAAAAERLRGLLPFADCQLGSVEVRRLDLASLDSVRRFADDFNASGRELGLLICNAGIMAPPERLESADGNELQLQANFLGHWLLTMSLVSEQRRRRRRARCSQGGKPMGGGVRVVNLTSMTHHGGKLDFGELQARQRYNPFQQYANTKLANLVSTMELQRRFERGGGSPDVAVAVHPGLVDTALARGYFGSEVPSLLRPLLVPLLETVFFPFFLRTPQASARTVLYAATAPAEVVAGRYVSGLGVARHAARADDHALAARLWSASCELTGSQIPAELQ